MSPLPSGSEVQAVIIGILTRTLGTTSVAPTRSTRLRHDLGLDSLGLIDLAIAAEDASGVRIPDEDLERFVTVGDLADYVQQTGR